MDPVMQQVGPRFLYLHGFASGPGSTKGVALKKHFAGRDVALDLLDVRKPSFERLLLSSILEETQAAIGQGPQERAVVFGSSLGGLAAARAAELDPRICALVLLAPGFRIAEQLRRRLGEETFEKWAHEGWLQTHDYATGQLARVHYGFFEEACLLDAKHGGYPDVRVPTLILHGTKDDTCNIEYSRTFARGKRHVRLVELDDGHELTASIPQIAAEAESFLAPLLG